MEAQQQAQPGIRKVDENRGGQSARRRRPHPAQPEDVGSTSGFMGVATIPAGDWISEHYHPYSEEFIYVARGTSPPTSTARRKP